MARGNVFALTFHCMVDGNTQRYKEEGAEQQLSFRLLFCRILYIIAVFH